MSRSRRRPDRRGVAATEFALMLPILALLLLCGTDMVQWLRAWFRLEQAAAQTTSAVGLATALTAAAFTGPGGYFTVATTAASPLAVSGAGGATIISCFVNNGTTTTIAWQEINTTNGAFVSYFGGVGQVPTLPPTYTVPSGQSAIATETFSSIHLWTLSLGLMGTTGPTTIHTYVISRPRSADLTSVQ